MRRSYEPLEKYLRSIPEDEFEVTLTFVEVASILETPMPASSLLYPAWWANQTDISKHAQARAWDNAGFRVNKLSQTKTNCWVQFVRKDAARYEASAIKNDVELQATQARIAYFQNLLAQFRVTARLEEFPVLAGSYRAEIEKKCKREF